MNPFGIESPNLPGLRQPSHKIREGQGVSYETRRAELYPEVRNRVDKLYAELQGIYAKYFVKSVRELQEKTLQGKLPLKTADVERISRLVDALEKLLETNVLEGFERILTLGPNEPMIEWHASDGHVYIERKQKNGEKAVLLDGKNEVYRGRYKGCLVRDGEVYINEAEGSKTHLAISRAGAKKRFGFAKRVIYRGTGQNWEVSGGKVFIQDFSQTRLRILLAKKHQTFGADETELIFEDDGRSMLGQPQYDNGHVYVSVMDAGGLKILKDGRDWKVLDSTSANWHVEGDRLVSWVRGIDGKNEYSEDGVRVENLGKKYGNHYYSSGRGPNNESQIIQDGEEVIIENALGWRFNEDALYVRVEGPDGGSIFFKITGDF